MREVLPPMPKWEQMLRRAHAVEVRVTTLLPERDADGHQNLFILDPNVAWMSHDFLLAPPVPLPTLLLCRPEHEGVARSTLRALGITPLEAP